MRKYIFPLYDTTGKVVGQHTAESNRYDDAVKQVKQVARSGITADIKNVTIDDNGKKRTLRL